MNHILERAAVGFGIASTIAVLGASIAAVSAVQRVAQQDRVRQDSRPGIACTQEARQCPDGSYVSRIGPACEFARCPGESTGALTGDECASQGGEIVNTLHFSDENPPDYSASEVLGEIRGTNCPCVCVRRVSGDQSGGVDEYRFGDMPLF